MVIFMKEYYGFVSIIYLHSTCHPVESADPGTAFSVCPSKILKFCVICNCNILFNTIQTLHSDCTHLVSLIFIYVYACHTKYFM